MSQILLLPARSHSRLSSVNYVVGKRITHGVDIHLPSMCKAVFTTKVPAWPRVQTSRDGRHWPLATFTKEYKAINKTERNHTCLCFCYCSHRKIFSMPLQFRFSQGAYLDWTCAMPILSLCFVDIFSITVACEVCYIAQLVVTKKSKMQQTVRLCFSSLVSIRTGPNLDRLLPIGPCATSTQTYIIYRSCLCSSGTRPSANENQSELRRFQRP